MIDALTAADFDRHQEVYQQSLQSIGQIETLAAAAKPYGAIGHLGAGETLLKEYWLVMLDCGPT